MNLVHLESTVLYSVNDYGLSDIKYLSSVILNIVAASVCQSRHAQYSNNIILCNEVF